MRKRTLWQDHVLSETGKYRVTDTDISDVKYITPFGEVMQQGTMQDANHFNGIEDGLDAHELAINLLLNKVRLDFWKFDEITEKLLKNAAVYTVTKEMTNSGIYPFNNSRITIPLPKACENVNYIISAEVISFNGNVGEVDITDKLTNGFKAAYTGSAPFATVKFTIIGGWNV